MVYGTDGAARTRNAQAAAGRLPVRVWLWALSLRGVGWRWRGGRRGVLLLLVRRADCAGPVLCCGRGRCAVPLEGVVCCRCGCG